MDQGGIDTHRHPVATWYITLQNSPTWHPELQLRLEKVACLATLPPKPLNSHVRKKQLASLSGLLS